MTQWVLSKPAKKIPNSTWRGTFGTAEESVKCWKLLKQAASLQDAMLNWARTYNILAHDIPNDGRYDYGRYNLPWLLPADFSKIIGDMI